MESDQTIPENVKEEDILNILVASDCHLGYAERDPVRCNDSITTFEEILFIAQEKKVDFVLLGGDLFHENKPSRKVLHDAFKLFRKYCMGDQPVQVEFLSDQSENFKDTGIVNYEDQNLNISIPIFSIHGNHDDPAGLGILSALDLFSVSGIVNYFGKCTDLSHIQISPLLMQKGKTKLALYGLGAVRDERLHRLFRDRKVSMLRPRENSSEWFNIFVLHQNRVKHGATNYIPEQFLDDFLDLIIWGHEHECRIKPEWNSYQNFYVSQPGSSVATSLCPGEAVPKHVGLLQIYKKNFKMTKIPLCTVRQFFIEAIDLNETSLNPEETDIQEKVVHYCMERVEELLDKAMMEHSGDKQPKKPLIRIRVEHDDQFESFSVQRFGQKYVDRVANPKDILHFRRKKKIAKKSGLDIDVDMLDGILKPEFFEKSKVEDLIKQYFQQQTDESKRLFLLTETGMKLAVQEFVEKDGKFAINDLVNKQLTTVQSYLKGKNVEDSAVDEEIYKFKEDRQKSKEEESEVQTIFEHSRMKSSVAEGDGRVSEDERDEDDDESSFISTSSRGTSGRRGRASRGRAGGSKARGSTNSRNTSLTNDQSRGRRSRSNNRGKKKEPVANTIQYAFQKQKQKLPFSEEFSDEDNEIVFSDEDHPKKQAKTRTTKTGKRGIRYDSDDSF